MSIVLFDLDGVLAHWGNGYGLMLDTFGEEALEIPRHAQQMSFNLHENMTDRQKELITQAMSTMDYFALDPMDGGIEAVATTVDLGHEVFICTSPWLANPNCVRDKLAWVDHWMGPAMADRTIITKDKTLVKGDVLVDDKPNIKGVAKPTWVQVLFDQPYNQTRTDLLRLKDWSEWNAMTRGLELV